MFSDASRRPLDACTTASARRRHVCRGGPACVVAVCLRRNVFLKRFLSSRRRGRNVTTAVCRCEKYLHEYKIVHRFVWTSVKSTGLNDNFKRRTRNATVRFVRPRFTPRYLVERRNPPLLGSLWRDLCETENLIDVTTMLSDRTYFPEDTLSRVVNLSRTLMAL